MPAVHRLGDENDDDAEVYDIAQGTVYANGLLVSIDGSQVEGHDTGEHDDPETANGSPTVFSNGISVNRQGDPDTCGCPRDSGSPDVFVGP